jgi:PAS domain S-box-containing protein
MPLTAMIRASPIAAVVTNPRWPDNPIVECNDAFVVLTGYSRDEVIGRNCRFLAGPGTEPAATEKIRGAVRRQQPVLVEILNYKKNGTPFRNAVMIAPTFDEAGRLEYFLGSQVEIAADLASGSNVRRGEANARVAALSRRQREVLLHMAAGKLSKQIAHELGLSVRTVELYRLAVFKALDVRTGADAIRLAIEAGY